MNSPAYNARQRNQTEKRRARKALDLVERCRLEVAETLETVVVREEYAPHRTRREPRGRLNTLWASIAPASFNSP